jgi:alkylation response protein AidB-like acyl-CoA dehydrogenase
VDLSLTPEQVGLSETLQRLLADLYPAAVLSTDEEPRAADRLWAELTGSGWLGVGVPEELGGSGGGAIELAIIFRHLGRAVAPSRYRSAVLARLLVRALARDDQLSEILPVLSAGQQTATVAYAEDGAENDPDHMATVAKHDGAGWRLSGAKALVPDASSADFLIVAARAQYDGALAFFRVNRAAPGLSITDRQIFSRDPYSDVVLSDVPADSAARLGSGDSTATYLRYRDSATALTAMEMVGSLERVHEIMIGHVTSRTQFGVPVGSFQAVQHHAADVAIALAGARLAAWKAVVSHDQGRPSAIAKAAAGRALRNATVLAHQVCGGMGYTTESPLHRYSERAMTYEILLGGWDYQLERVAVSLGL